MSTLEIVLLALMAGVLIALLIASIGYLLWMLHATRKFLVEVQTAAINAKQAIGLLESQIRTTLHDHRQELNQLVSRINGDRLVEASNVIQKAAQRIESACVAFGELSKTLLSGEFTEELGQVRKTSLGPEEYAPNPTGERYVTQSRTAAADSAELVDEQESGQ